MPKRAIQKTKATSPFSALLAQVKGPAVRDFQWRPESYASAKRVLKNALIELYKLLGYIKSFRTLNQTGFAKILKKYEKVTASLQSNSVVLIRSFSRPLGFRALLNS